MTQQSQNLGGSKPRGGGSAALALILAWTVVGLPAAWGVTQTVKKSLPLFKMTSSAVQPATQPAPAAPH
jgi:hypothetical protein